MNEIAARYGNALFMIARDEDKIVSMREEIKELKEIFDENPSFSALLNNSFLSQEERKETLAKCLPGVNKDVVNLLKILVDHDRGGLVNDVLESFISYCNEALGITEGIVYSAARLSPDELVKVNDKVSKLEQKTTDLKNVVDPELIGGIRVVISGHIYDGSIKNKLETMKKSLLKKEAQ